MEPDALVASTVRALRSCARELESLVSAALPALPPPPPQRDPRAFRWPAAEEPSWAPPAPAGGVRGAARRLRRALPRVPGWHGAQDFQLVGPMATNLALDGATRELTVELAGRWAWRQRGGGVAATACSHGLLLALSDDAGWRAVLALDQALTLRELDAPPRPVAPALTLAPRWRAEHGPLPVLHAAWDPQAWTLPPMLAGGDTSARGALALSGLRGYVAVTHARSRLAPSLGRSARHCVRVSGRLGSPPGGSSPSRPTGAAYKLKLPARGLSAGLALGGGRGAPCTLLAKGALPALGEGYSLGLTVGVAGPALGAVLGLPGGLRVGARWAGGAMALSLTRKGC